MVKKTRKLLIGGRRKKTRRKKRGGGEETKTGLTEHFELRRGESFGEIVDLYLSEIDSVGKGVTDKKLMDDILKKVEEIAHEKTNNTGIGNLYDGNNNLPAILDMRTDYMSEDTYITPEVQIMPAGTRYKRSCDGKNVLIKWTIRLKTFSDQYQDERHQEFQGIDPGLLFKRLYHNLMKHTIANDKNDNANYPKIIIPIGIPEHSMCAILTVHQSDEEEFASCKLYFADPNGYRNASLSNPSISEFAQTTIDCKNALITEAGKHNIKYAGDFLCDLQPQTAALKFIDSDGFCGGFTAFLCFLFLNNPDESVENIGRYIRKREEQWQNSTDHDWAKMAQRLWDEFTFKDKSESDLGYWNPGMGLNDKGVYVPKDLSTIKNKKTELWDDSVRNIGWWIDSGTVSYKGNTIKNMEDYRKSIIEMLGDEVPLDWFECHIIMFLIYLDEYNEKYAPLNFYGKKNWKKAQAMLYDNGREEKRETAADKGDAGVREYPGAYCYIKAKDRKGFFNVVDNKFNRVCEGMSPEEFEKKTGKKLSVTKHDS